jgi:hypothetical protein
VGSFSIWHWIIVLILVSPFIIGVTALGWQRTIFVRHRESGLVKRAYLGWSWTYQLFGWFVPVFRGEVGIALLHLAITIFTFGIFQIVMPFLYNKQQMTRLLTSGWELSDSEEVETYARKQLGMPMP